LAHQNSAERFQGLVEESQIPKSRKEPRALTNRERARLQTFPDDFVFQGSKESVRKQIGMAVPPLGARVILEAVLKTMAGISYASVEPKWKNESIWERQPQLALLEKRRHNYG
jgi:DNA (cytosine-5)-methyltransferase 1